MVVFYICLIKYYGAGRLFLGSYTLTLTLVVYYSSSTKETLNHTFFQQVSLQVTLRVSLISIHLTVSADYCSIVAWL